MSSAYWFLDVYEDLEDGVAVWLMAEDGTRLRLRHRFPVTFYAAGPTRRLHALCRFLKTQPVPVELSRVERRDLFRQQPQVVLGVQVQQAAALPRLFQQVSANFPDLTYYDADLSLSLRYAAEYGVFPLARCEVVSGRDGWVQQIAALDSPWDIDPEPAPLRVLSLEPDINPFHTAPRHVSLYTGRFSYHLPLQPERPFLVNLCAILRRHDPDLLLTSWGNSWLLPRLLDLSRRWRIPAPLNRDESRRVAFRRERTYFSYGRVIYRGRECRLFGRMHVDRDTHIPFEDDLEGILELARVTALPIQTSAGVSPGAGISAMQVLTALRQGILVPWRKQRAEDLKTALDLMHADQGGLVYRPLVGLHRDVAEIDFISMYPSIMARFNISPETVGAVSSNAPIIPQLGIPVDQERVGLVPQTLEPLLEKRLALKERQASLPAWDPRRKVYAQRALAHKWLLVTCFGYLGYKNARFGRIEAHEAVTAYGREALIQAKEAAEDRGCTVLHLYVDGMWAKRAGASMPADFQPLLDEIAARTGLPVALDGIYRWVAFLPSRQDARLPVANRYFGVFQDGSLKTRGIEARRSDTPPFVARTQMEILERMARAPGVDRLPALLPEIVAMLRRRLHDLRRGQVPLESLLASQKLSRNLDAYRTPSPAARAAAQLETAGKTVKRGQRVRFLYTLGDPGVYAWDLPAPPDPASVDVARYTELLLRAAETVLQPLGVDERTLRDWLLGSDCAFQPTISGLKPAVAREANPLQRAAPPRRMALAGNFVYSVQTRSKLRSPLVCQSNRGRLAPSPA